MNMKKIPSLNGLRAISITIVILYHLLTITFRFDTAKVSRILIFNGLIGVNIFFVISGFLITALLLNEEAKAGHVSIANFYTRRMLRIFPAYFFMLAVYFVLQLAGILYIPGISWLTALTYTKYLNAAHDHYTAHAWSLSVEESFYLIWPMVFTMGSKFRELVIYLLIGAVPVIRLFVFIHPVNWITQNPIFTREDSIAVGCFFALYKTKILTLIEPIWNRVSVCSLVALFSIPWIDYFARGAFGGFLIRSIWHIGR